MDQHPEPSYLQVDTDDAETWIMQMKENTQPMYRRVLRLYAEFMLSSPQTDPVKSIYAFLRDNRDIKKEISTTTANVWMAILRAYYRNHKLIIIKMKRLPMTMQDEKDLQEKRADRVRTTDELLEVLKGASNDYQRILLYILLLTGARIGEVKRLRFRDMDFRDNGVILNMWTEKQHVDNPFRKVVVNDPPEAIELMKSVYEKNKGLDQNREVFPCTTATLYNWLQSMQKRSGYDRHIWSHLFRHHLITKRARQGMNVSEIGGIVGHRTAAVTMSYIDADTARVSNPPPFVTESKKEKTQ